MLKHLSIRNYALIRKLELDFRSGLTIVTGETGAGKSILLGALNLLLGERSDANAIQNASQKCIVEGRFLLKGDELHHFFDEHNLDWEAECTLRREIVFGGKSRAFINDTPVTLQQLKYVSNSLLDIHGQHDTILINDSAFRLQLMDGPSGTIKQQKAFEVLFNQWNKSERLLKQLRDQQEALSREFDFIRFQLDELESAAVYPGELHQSEEEFRWLNSASEIGNILSQALHFTDDENRGILAQLKALSQQLRQAERLSERIEPLSAKLLEISTLVSDLSFELNRESERCEVNPVRMEQLSARIDLLNRLLHKHRLKSEAELIVLKDELTARLYGADLLSHQIDQQEQEVKSLFTQLESEADRLHSQRLKTVPALTKSIIHLLKSLGMPDVRFEVRLNRTTQFDRFGNTHVELLFSANKGSDLVDISKSASGGERSRVMLALKKVMASSVDLPTIIFDEIDTGVSGAVADAVGEVLSQMGQCMQVLCITHLAQIAAKGNDHLKVVKRSEVNSTETQIMRLNMDERTDEIAAMLSGKKLSDEARLNAKALLQQNQV
jgi:DNA repair protein RecN (Recombination protein N)